MGTNLYGFCVTLDHAFVFFLLICWLSFFLAFVFCVCYLPTLLLHLSLKCLYVLRPFELLVTASIHFQRSLLLFPHRRFPPLPLGLSGSTARRSAPLLPTAIFVSIPAKKPPRYLDQSDPSRKRTLTPPRSVAKKSEEETRSWHEQDGALTCREGRVSTNKAKRLRQPENTTKLPDLSQVGPADRK